MQETVREVLFETRQHATQSFSPDLSQQQLDDGAKGGFFSLFSARGLNQLKEKWNEGKRPRTLSKWALLFVSPRGDYVAVAVRNRITIFRKDDNYMDPCGVFTSNDRRNIFTHGAWSDSHGVLGVIDDMNTLFFIKSNGEEITRMTKRQLKTPAQIIGLIVREDLDAKSSCLCGFNILMSDGLLHHVEVSQDLSASISYMSASSNRTTLLKQFPKNVSCIDFHPEFSMLVLVGGVDCVLENSGGFYFLHLWRVTKNSGLELMFCSPHFEGLFSTPRGYVTHFTTPKVAISPLGKYVAALDLTGSLDIFNVDSELYSLSIFASGKKCDSQRADNLLLGRGEFLNDIVDFTWWSDHVLVIAKRSGLVTMFDILGGMKCLENDRVFSMPILERVRQCQGCVFLLDSATSDGRNLPITSDGREGMGVQDMGRATWDQLDVSRLHWNLLSFSERSASEMYTILIKNQEYQAAMEFARHHGLDRDEVFKSQWLHSIQGTDEINMLLSNIEDKKFVLSECVHKIGPTEDAMRALLSFGLRITDQYRFSESDDDGCSLIWHFRMVRLQLLQCRDKLETFVGINMGRFSVLEYGKFRIMPLNEAAITIAESGKIGALNLLFKRHPYSISPFILNILSAIPETVPVQTYGQLLPGRHPPSTVALRDRDWVECEKMIDFIERVSKDNENNIQMKTELIVKQCKGLVWPSVAELSLWYKNRARDIDSLSGQLDNCLSMVEFACNKGISELQQFCEDILYLSQLIYSDICDDKINFTMSLVAWEQLADYDKFKLMLMGVKEDTVVGRLQEKAIPFMQNRSCTTASVSENFSQNDSFLVRWLKEISEGNKLDIFLMVIEEGCLQIDGIFKDVAEVLEVTLQCIYLCSLTDRWNSMASVLSKLPQLTLKGNKGGYLESVTADKYVESLERRLRLAEGHVEAGRLLAYYQVPKPMSFFLGVHSDEKSVKQLLRLILSKFGRRQPGRSDNEWANMWRDMQCLQEKAFPFLDTEYMLMEFCRGLLKAGKFSLARNYLKGTGTITLATEKAENLVIQAAREYFFSASSLACMEIWKAKECLNLFPNSKNIKAESDVIDALTVKLPNLGVTLLPMQYRQIRNPMEIINMVVTSQTGAYLDVDELIEIAKLLGLTSQDDIAAVQEVVAREAAVNGDLQQAFDLCVVLAKKGHGPIWDLCAAIARGPALDNMDTSSRKQLIGFALSHCDEESISELLHAWKDLDTQFQCEKLMKLTGTNPPKVVQDSSHISLSTHNVQDMLGLRNYSDMVEGSIKQEGNDDELHFQNIKSILSLVAKDIGAENGTNWDSLLRENGKFLSFAALQLPWLLELSRKDEYGQKMAADTKTQGKQYMSLRTQAMLSILSWLARNDIAPHDALIASVAKSVMEPPVTKEEDVTGCSFLLNLADAFHGVQIIEEQLRRREEYQEICSIMEIGMTYSLLHNGVLDCSSPPQRRKLLLHKFHERHPSMSSDTMDTIDKSQPTFWREWKSKLEEQKRYADQTRDLEQIIPGVDTTRFLSGDFDYIQSAVFTFIDSAKSEKKPILKEALKLADTYSLKRSEVLLRFLANALVSELWTNDDIIAEISNYKEEILTCAVAVINMVSSVIFPVIDGHNKLRLAYLYRILSECFSQIKGSEQMLVIHRDISCIHNLGLSQFYKVLEQECRRVSFIIALNFKNIAGLGDLDFDNFNDEVCRNICESNVETLAKMVETLVVIYDDSVAEGLISGQDVYRHHVVSSVEALEMATNLKLHPVNPDDLIAFIAKLEQNYDCCRFYIRFMSEAHVLDIIGRYYASSLPHFCSECCLSREKDWKDCLELLLKLWIRLTDEIQEIVSQENSEEKHIKSRYLSKCFKVFRRLVIENEVSTRQGWGTVSDYAKHRPLGDYTSQAFSFCKAMVFSGCGFKATAKIFTEAAVATLSRSEAYITGERDSIQNLTDFYLNMVDLVLLELGSDSADRRNLHNLLSSLSKLEGDLEELRRVRYAVCGRLGEFSDNMQVPSHIRVYSLEVMQLIAGRNLRSLPDELISEVQQWEGWDELHCTTNSKTSDVGLPKQLDGPKKFTNTLVALKSSQLVSAISPRIEITPEDLSTLDLAVSCFFRLCEASCSESHLDILQAVLEEWEGLFSGGRDEQESCESQSPNNGNTWSNDGWDDEGWESFQEEPTESEGKKDESVSIHPLHVCWMEIIKKLVELSQLSKVMKLIDHSLSKPKCILLAEDEAQSLSELLIGIDCFMALKIMLLLPYEALWFQCFSALDVNLKESISGTMHGEFELLTIAISSGVLSTIATECRHCEIFSYFCNLVGRLSRLCQEAQLSMFKHGGRDAKEADGNGYFLFSRVLFPCFVSELVKARHFLLAGFLVSQFMHSNTSLSLINVAEASLRKYLEGHTHTQWNDGPDLDQINVCRYLLNTVSRLRVKTGSLLQSALSALPSNVK